MRALRFHKTGDLPALQVEEVPTPAPGPGEVLVRVRAAAINPSDVKNVQGKMHQTTVPRTPGRDFAGVVEAGAQELEGEEVFGSGGDLGFTRDGSHAAYVVVPREAVVAKPASLSFEQAAAVGVGYLTAWAAMVTAGGIQQGETVLIVGVTGAVGSAAAAVVKARGGRVIGTVRQASEPRGPSERFVDHFIDLSTQSIPEGVKAATAGRGANLAMNVVGGPLLDACNRALAHRGRQVVIAATGDPTAHLHLPDFYHQELRLIGVDTLKLSFAEAASILRELLPGFETGRLPTPPVTAVRLEDAPEAFARIDRGQATGKLVIVF